LATLCALVAGGVTWITMDAALVKIEELRYREEMRAEILGALQAQKAEIAEEMRKAHAGYVDAMARNLAGSVDKVFVPARDGRA